MGRPATLPATSHRATSTAPKALVETDRFIFHIRCQMAPISKAFAPTMAGLTNSMSGPAYASAPCREEPRKAWPSTPASVWTVTTPRSLWPPKPPVPVRHGALFQLNMVTLTSVIFTLGLLMTSCCCPRRVGPRTARRGLAHTGPPPSWVASRCLHDVPPHRAPVLPARNNRGIIAEIMVRPQE